MAKKITGPRIATANRLLDGLVVFLDGQGEWTRDLQAATVVEDDAEVARLERDAVAAAKANIVVDPYLIQVTPQNGHGFIPVANRERMRRNGPTVGNSIGA